MARFTSSQWAVANTQNIGYIVTASTSQDLFESVGIRKGSGKLSLKQAVYKLHHGQMWGESYNILSFKDGVLYKFERTFDVGRGQSEYVIREYTEGKLYDLVADAFGNPAPKAQPLPKSAPSPSAVKSATKKTSAEEQLVSAIQALSGTASLDEDKVKAIVDEQIRKATMPKVVEVSVSLPNGTTNVVKGQHKLFPKLLKYMGAKKSVLMVGDAGSGKTYGAMMAAKALGLDYRVLSFTPQTSLGKLVGFKNAMGEYTKGLVRDMYENGGVLILDELDACDESVLVGLNNLLEGSEYTFDDGVVERHEDFRYVACTNTFGQGANKQYNGRRKLDASSLDRFATTIEWGYDEDLERLIFGDTTATRAVQSIRKNAKSMGITITPRRTRAVNDAVALGFSLREAVEDAILTGRAKDVVRGLLDGVSL